MRLVKPSKVFRIFFPSLIWQMPKTDSKTIYLTFDDGPHPLITPKVLEILKLYDAKATFFCIGNNVKKYPETFKLIKKEGHSIGCHTFNHENGWKTKTDDYLKSFNDANELIHSSLFRPPHGKIKYSQLEKLRTWHAESLQVVAWTVIAYDWDHSLSHEDVYQNVIKNADDGSIITFHDSIKAYNNMIFALPKVLKYYHNLGFKFKAL
ncbi:MAG: polysaccharide deacetylase family protein [Bacteroidales bacterium]|nr:polysaccharide deacetylase family protein [Bacteroidales bacterium]